MIDLDKWNGESRKIHEGINKTIRDIFLDWTNNHLSLKGFANSNEMTIGEARSILEVGKSLHEKYVEEVVKELYKD
tara:strand:+ start:190 stop:417 length:228 start_codon:yes stop_codon:yes gene_type:complete